MSTVSEGNQSANNAQSTTIDQGTSTEKHEEVHKKLEGHELLDAIRKQVEYYFSRQNLANDPFLVQHMNNQLFVPIDFIATFKLVKNLTEDVNLIREAIKQSKSVLLDETGTKIKPDFNIPRNTVILRDIPSSTDVEVVRKIFSSDNMPKQIQSQIGDNWFVIFDTDDQALLALDQIRGKEIDGHAVHARIKTENILKAFAYYASPNSQQPQQTTQYQQPQQGAYGRGYNRNGNQWDQQDQNNRQRGGGRGQKPNTPGKGQGRKKENTQSPQPKKGRQSPDQEQKPRSKSAKSARPTQQEQSAPVQQVQPQTDLQNDQHDARSAGRGKRRPSFTRAHPPPTLGSKNFPPLPTISKAELLKSGYENDKYLSYPKGAIISVYNSNLKNGTLTRPDDLPDCAAVLSAPKAQLELTKPPLPHHEVQQDPEHVEEGEEAPKQEKEATKKSSPVHAKQPLQGLTLTVPTTSSVAQSELPPSVVKSFAEAAITAKDIKTPDFPRTPEQPQKRRNSLKGGKPGRLEEEATPQPPAQTTPGKSRSGRRNSIGGGRSRGRRNSLEKGETKDNSSPKPPKKQPRETPTGEPLTIKTTSDEKSKKKKSKPTKKDDKAQDAGVATPSPTSQDNKSYASIVNKIKSSASPKSDQPQSPKQTDTTQQAFGIEVL